MLTPSDDAIDAMTHVLGERGLSVVEWAPEWYPIDRAEYRKVLAEVLVAGAEHLTDAGQPVLETTPWPDRFSAIIGRFDQLEARLSDDRAVPDLATRLDQIDEGLAALRRDDVAWVTEVCDAYRKGQATGSPDAEARPVPASLQDECRVRGTTKMLDFLVDRFDGLERLLVDHRDECERLASASSTGDPVEVGRRIADTISDAVGRREAEILERLAEDPQRLRRGDLELQFQAGYQAGHEAGRTAAIVPTVELGECVTGPTDYEVWRDACNLAAGQPYDGQPSAETLTGNAEWWWQTLQEVPVQQQDLVEDEDGAPLAPEHQPCPECRAGKHLNCLGEVLDHDDNRVACPCKEGACEH